MSIKPIFALALLAALWSCSPKTAPLVPPPSIPIGERPLPAQTADEAIAFEEGAVMPDKTPYEMASLQRTACYGQCPVFEAKVYSDGQVTYSGRRYAAREGEFVAQASEEWVQQLLQAAEKAQYFTLANSYPASGEFIPDLPNTITFLSQPGKDDKRITNNHEAPQALVDFEKYFDAALETLSWKRTSPREVKE